ncbi:MAG TPA: Gfo/Idh/MocA family oxidoreductase [Planctomycetota bacterium]|nr:Gfo/Idh/MocA family oxidoreductase [Planctomycetota bacterium]OQC21193.1 MAG: Inositol 2-dehydrogenase [Planctomycetes bacterium ADurb.Bin069]NMD36368.1 Gfo/Idh/MocA family oxidoreductase [Planctomycetota bacterium]HNR99130.1 Gfo/Idh/MocA family oxidoreductase [Planctomycetota bacterium]HNU25833.1 Gfo/Idh/MocA family oxidoreductase [Planctomycetota bacterium]
MLNRKDVSRRSFLRGAAAGAVAAPSFLPAAALGADGAPPPSDRVAVGLIGCGGMGRENLKNCTRHADVVAAAVCDVNKERLDATRAEYAATAQAFTDYRALLDMEDLDGVIIATPPHWHALQAIHACEARKDLFLQKPMTLYLAESLAVKNAVARHKRVSQIGTQIHAGENYRRVVELVRSGNLGKISVVRTFNVMNQGREGLGKDPNTTPPEGLDWNAWLGPAPARLYNRILATGSYEHSSFMDYGGGWTPGMAPHILDLPVWALDLGYPTYVASTGGRFTIDDDGDAPDVQEILWQYPGLTVTWMMSLVNSYGFDLHGEPVPQRRLGIYFHGLNGTLYCDYGTHKIVPEGKAMEGAQPPASRIPPSPGHEREWIECIRSRKEPSCCVAYHTKVDVPIVLGNLALRLGRALKFDPAKAAIVGDEEAARLSMPQYRTPYRFPAEYL